jgi:hypothetical protein
MSESAERTRNEAGPWNPGLQSQVPSDLRSLCTIYREANVSTSPAAAAELRLLTGLPEAELVAFRPRRLLLHELLVRVTADFSVPDGPRIEDLGIDFRRITTRLLQHYLEPQLPAITEAFETARRQLRERITATLATLTGTSAAPAAVPPRRGLARWLGRPPPAPAVAGVAGACDFDTEQIGECQRLAAHSHDPLQAAACRALARVLGALFATHGQAWGTRELIVALATDLACNSHGSALIGAHIEPLLLEAARAEGYGLLPRQDEPVVINTKGPSASGKSSLRPLQKQLAGELGLAWHDFALISPDIWRKQLLDYGSLGAAYKYAGAFTADELQIIDQKLDRYMAAKSQRGFMPHLLIDRFRFDSFAPDSDEAGSNLLTRFGHNVYLFFMITPPEMLVERAWKRGLEVGRYKAVDDTLAHGVEAYTGMPDVFFTWVGRADKRIQFEFLDNSVPLGTLPLTVAFGTNDTLNVLDVGRMLDIESFGRVNVAAHSPDELYRDDSLLAPEHNLGFLRRCIGGFREVNFADQASGRIYLRCGSATALAADARGLAAAAADARAGAALRAVLPRAFEPATAHTAPLGSASEAAEHATLGQWGSARPRGTSVR